MHTLAWDGPKKKGVRATTVGVPVASLFGENPFLKVFSAEELPDVVGIS